MRVVIQRTSQAKVSVGNKILAEIRTGLLVLVGIHKEDTRVDAEYLAHKVPKLRVFEDSAGKMNLDVSQIGGSILIVPNFTLYGDCGRGSRPGFDAAAPPGQARPLFEYFVERVRSSNVDVQLGLFQAHMEVSLVNDGPVTLVIDAPHAPTDAVRQRAIY